MFHDVNYQKEDFIKNVRFKKVTKWTYTEGVYWGLGQQQHKWKRREKEEEENWEVKNKNKQTEQ